ncbi:sensor histidine kinase [uncultured Dokdonia sp.]|uniref:tetratricopeptide repeat-containing sensor histidine kinase n=1 Tax=uncultured Dokdonia sp. TaxID=575653 RepID=UPI0026375D36|nr:sensor histidine kinase [uncultured Dokdonia sp.]
MGKLLLAPDNFLLKKPKFQILIITLLLLFNSKSFIGQNYQFKKIDSLLINLEYKKAQEYLSTIDTVTLNEFKKAHWYLNYCKSLTQDDRQGEGYNYCLKALNIFNQLDSIKWRANTNRAIIKLLSHQNSLKKIDRYIYINNFINDAEKINSPSYLSDAYLIKGTYFLNKRNGVEAIKWYKKSISKALIIQDSVRVASLHTNIGLSFEYTNYKDAEDSVIYYYEKALPIFKKNNQDTYTSYLYNNLSKLYQKKKQYDAALKYLKLAEKTDVKVNISKTKLIYLKNFLSIYSEKEDYKEAIFYAKLLLKLKDSINELAQNNTIIEADKKYKTLEKEKENLKLEVKNKRSQTIAISLGSTLLLGSIIAFLVYRNTKRKQRIAEQDRELQIQKTETILKEKELETINAMVSGQEKERLRLAGELHDNLGSTLATVRMQVENLERNLDKVDDPKALLQKTNALVNEAYQKVRTISHERNSGVLAKNGLLPAIQKLARTVSSNNNLQVEVQDFGLENRIANELEITIFRIIQELVTNIVKHANAGEANISLTQHDNELNIMVEDNGKGFKVGKLKEKDGMGLGNIERRIEHLEGTMEVDSALGRGTSISIDIPL